MNYFPLDIVAPKDDGLNAVCGQAGIALYLVLWILLILTVIVGQFCYGIRVETKITSNFKESTQAYYIAHAGFISAVDFLMESKGSPWKIKKVGDNKPETDQEDKSTWRINSTPYRDEFGSGSYEVYIDNESGKININKANAALLKIMLASFEISDDQKNVIVDSILDWRDKDTRHRLHGAEYDYYKSMNKPYVCRDGDFQTVDELLFVRGVTEEMYYGGLKDIVTVSYINPLEGLPDWKIREFRDKGIINIGYDYSKININAATPAVLSSLPGMTKRAIDAIMSYRRNYDFNRMGELRGVVGDSVYDVVFRFLTLDSIPIYRIYAYGEVGKDGLKEGIEALVRISDGPNKSYKIYEWTDRIEKSLSDEAKEVDIDS